jgi:hypothetical protein
MKTKYVITFGSGQLTEFFVRPTNVMLVIEAETENQARQKACNFTGIGSRFCTSYKYDEVKDEFLNRYGMKEYTLEDLETKRIK